ncbi:MAG: ATP synthase F1 subunit gamma [Acidobacteria bacterium]|nr:ATP synthase F1 subunit gamma [Acidobacteriota bacterium]
MANLRDVRRRIRSVRNIQKTTRAMKFVSASKLKRAQDRVVAARPYANRMLAVLNSLISRVENRDHALLQRRGSGQILLVIITGDKGLCGAFNSNIIKAATVFLNQKAGAELSLAAVGRKGYDFFKRRPYEIRAQYINIMGKLAYEEAKRIADFLIQQYSALALDEVYIVYNEFKSVIQQRVTVERLLPIGEIEGLREQVAPRLDYIYEQEPQTIFSHLLPRHVDVQVYRAMLESAASEHGARMTAMDAATTNAKDMIERLTLNMNRIRQASITKEIIEIVSGANALAGK